MQTTEDHSARLRADLVAFIGTENWHRHPTQSVDAAHGRCRLFRGNRGLWWFLDIVATEVMRFHRMKPFLVIDLDVNDGKAEIRVSDGNDAVLFTRHIHFTDAPEGLWRFYLTDNVMLLPSEY